VTNSDTPAGTIAPYLSVHDAAAAIEFYIAAFGATETFRVVGDDERIGHANLQVGSATLMLSDEYPDFGAVSPRTLGGTPVALHLEVADCDATFVRAVELGAEPKREPADESHGSRNASIVDPFGHRWMLSQTLETFDLDTYAERERDGGGFDVRPAHDD
jgi:uncharacterized glyoxalase superfamily protein PhnB